MGRAGLIYPADWPDLEVGWLVRSDRRGRGYATEAAAAALHWAFEELGERRCLGPGAPPRGEATVGWGARHGAARAAIAPVTVRQFHAQRQLAEHAPD